MRMRALSLVAMTCLCATVASPATAQDTPDALPLAQSAPKPAYTPEAVRRMVGQNAALGYWMAFALMKELPAGSSQDTDALLDANSEALATLARASRLTTCDWGLEYALGSRAPIAYLPKARALARVNSAAAVRSVARGRGDEAVDQWLVGMRFALHIESGGTLISTLSAWSALRETWGSIEPWVVEKKLSAAQLVRLADAVRTLPETVFRWDSAVLNEARVLQTQAALTPPGRSFTPPGDNDTKRFLREVERVADALSRSPEQAASVAATFDNEVRKELYPFYRDSMPSLTKVNETRREVKAARDRLLTLLK